MLKDYVVRSDSKSKWRIGANSYTHKRQRAFISQLIMTAEDKGPVSRVLDCPCGSGRMVDLLLPRHVTCADIQTNRLKDIEEYFEGKPIITRKCDVFNLPFDDDSFDLVLNCLLLQHIDKPRLQPLLTELRRVTNRWLIITYPSKFALANVLHKREKTLLTKSEFEDLVAASGFQKIQSHHVLPFVANCNIALLEKV